MPSIAVTVPVGFRQAMTDPKSMTETQWQNSIIAYATARGWRAYHTHDARRSAAGFPDLVLVRDGRLVAAELKNERRKPTTEQLAWLEDLRACIGVQVFLWRPRHVTDVMRVLA